MCAPGARDRPLPRWRLYTYSFRAHTWSVRPKTVRLKPANDCRIRLRELSLNFSITPHQAMKLPRETPDMARTDFNETWWADTPISTTQRDCNFSRKDSANYEKIRCKVCKNLIARYI